MLIKIIKKHYEKRIAKIVKQYEEAIKELDRRYILSLEANSIRSEKRIAELNEQHNKSLETIRKETREPLLSLLDEEKKENARLHEIIESRTELFSYIKNQRIIMNEMLFDMKNLLDNAANGIPKIVQTLQRVSLMGDNFNSEYKKIEINYDKLGELV